MIEIEHLHQVFRSGFFLRPKVGLEDLSLVVESNEVFGYLGKNGSGKTTTIKILVGLSRPTSGTARIMGKSIFKPEVRRLVGYLPELPYFYEYLTPWETLRFYGQLHGIDREILRSRIDHLLERVGLGDVAQVAVRNFSKGMRQRLGLAQALINDPQVVILDEPTTGLDPMGRQLVKEVIVELKEQGKTVFFSSHILPDVEAICDRVGLLEEGRLVKEGSIEDLIGDRPARIDIVAEGIEKGDFADLAAKILVDGKTYYLSVHDEKKKEEVIEKVNEKGGVVKYIIPHRFSLEEYFKMLGSTDEDREGEKEQ